MRRDLLLFLRLAFLAALLCLLPAAAAAAVHHVTVGPSLTFTDNFNGTNTTFIMVGDTVQWDWASSNSLPHSVVSGNCTTACTPSNVFNSGAFQTTGTFSFTFNTPGTFHYYCGFHTVSMQGQIVVQAPDFSMTTSNPEVTTFTTTAGVFNGNLTAQNGYNQTVTLSCTAGAPSTCTPNPASGVPPFPFTVTANDATPADYSFNIQATDGTLTHARFLLLHLLRLSAPSPGTVNAIPGTTSTSTTLTLNGGTAMAGTAVVLACSSGLPAGATCNFAPPGPYAISNAQVPVTMTVSVPASATGADSNVMVTATSGSASTSQTVVLHVTDYAVSLNAAEAATVPNTPVLFNGTLTALNGYTNGSIAVSCQGAGKPATCTGGTFALNGASTPFSINAADTPVQDFNFTVQAQASDGLTHSLPATLHIVNMALTTPSPAGVSVTPSALSAPVSFNLVPLNFSGLVTVQCRPASLPANVTCLFETGSGFASSRSVFIQGTPAPIRLVVKAQGATATGTPQQIFIDATTAVNQAVLTISQPLEVTVNTAATSTDLSVTLSHSPDPAPLGGAAPGGPLIYHATIANAANGADASNVDLNVSFTEPVVIPTVLLPPGCSTDGITVTCSTPTLLVSGVAIFDIQVIPVLSRSVTAFATVSSGSVTDSALANNSASETANSRFRPFARPGAPILMP